MAQNRKFSIIVPIYKKNYTSLPTSLLCLKEQDYKNFEVIIAYNSPDESSKKETVKLLKKEKSWLTYKEIDAGYHPDLKQGNHCNAFNVGAEIATGDYLLFLDPDIQLLPGILREYKDYFETNPEIDFLYGDYDFVGGGRIVGRRYNEYELKCANYVSGAFPIRKSAFKGWDPTVQSLQDWDMWYSAIDAGAKGMYLGRPCFVADAPAESGISVEGSKNWKERYSLVREKHNFPVSKTVVTSFGAPDHATNTAEMLGVDTRVLNNLHIYKPNDYQNVYVVGFYTKGTSDDPMVSLRNHIALFYKDGDIKKKELYPGKKIIHWVGTDIFMLQHHVSWMGVKFITNMLTAPDLGFIHLTEAEHTHDELMELGIESQIVPLPPKKLYKPMPLPAKFTIGIYTNPTQDMYFEEDMYELAAAMPDIDFKFFGTRGMKKVDGNKEWVGWVDMDTFLPTISALIRVTRHDGLPLGPLEAMTAGRQVICSTPLKYAVYHSTENGSPDLAKLVEQVRELQKTTLDTNASYYWRGELSHDRFKATMKGILG